MAKAQLETASFEENPETLGRRGPKTTYLTEQERLEWRAFVRNVLDDCGVDELDVAHPDVSRQDDRWIQRALSATKVSARVARAVVDALGSDERTWHRCDKLYGKLQKTGPIKMRRWAPHALDDDEMEEMIAYKRGDWGRARSAPIAIAKGDEVGVAELILRLLAETGAIKPSRKDHAASALTTFLLEHGNSMRISYFIRDHETISTQDFLDAVEDIRNVDGRKRQRAGSSKRLDKYYFASRSPSEGQ